MPRRGIRISGVTPDGQRYTGIVTVHESSHACSTCGATATLLCDYPVVRRSGAKGTCDRWMCSKCATVIGPDRHYCPPHERATRLPRVE